VVARFLQAAGDDGLHARWDVRGQRRRGLLGDAREQRGVAVGGEGVGGREHLVEDDAERPEVGAVIDVELAEGLLRAHVRGRSKELARERDDRRAVALADAEVDELGDDAAGRAA
jgi:hypothetical protein